MKTVPLGKLLNLPTFHHFYSLPISGSTSASSTYVLVFELDYQPVFVDLTSDTGYTSQATAASHLDKNQLLIALGAVPFPSLSTCQILEVRTNSQRKGIIIPELLILIENQNYPLLTSTCRTPVQPASRRLGYF